MLCNVLILIKDQAAAQGWLGIVGAYGAPSFYLGRRVFGGGLGVDRTAVKVPHGSARLKVVKMELDWMWWCMPVIQASGEAEARA